MEGYTKDTKQNVLLLRKSCKKCGKENHFVVTCRSKVSLIEQRKKVNAVAEQDSVSCEDLMTDSYIGDGGCESSKGHESDTERHTAVVHWNDD